jgi:GTPase
MFVDEVKIYVRSGKGGDGFVHFHREKYVARGGPDGGDGGRGGDVILEVIPTLNTLSSFRQNARYIADDGKKGGVSNMTGRSAENLIIPVAPGTLVYDADTGNLLGDLVTAGQQLMVCKGGRGGRGNNHYATPQNQAPRMGEKGVPAEEKNLRMELKLIADIGIVGLPNAGKSSFLAAVTNARPKIADYPFTTLEPNLGVAELDVEHSLILADIPGLIEGAHLGLGLGDSFLRHIQRTRVLIHMLDGSSQDPLSDFDQINSEMALFDPDLAKKPQVVVFNKIDLSEAQEKWPEVQKSLVQRGYDVTSISTFKHAELRPILWKVVELLKIVPVSQPVEELPVYKPADDARDFKVEHVSGGWVVRGSAIERAAAMTYWEFEGSVRRFQRLMEMLGVDDALRRAGAQNGDTVFIGNDYELEWMD